LKLSLAAAAAGIQTYTLPLSALSSHAAAVESRYSVVHTSDSTLCYRAPTYLCTYRNHVVNTHVAQQAGPRHKLAC
jgi:hypothetical protein